MSCWSWVTSASTRRQPSVSSSRSCTFFGMLVCSRLLICRTRSERSTGSTTKRPLPAYARSWRVRLPAVSLARTTSFSMLRAGLLLLIVSSARLAFPMMPTSRLLKSCAMPPASRPRLSSLSFCSSRRSSSLRSRNVARDDAEIPAARRPPCGRVRLPARPACRCGRMPRASNARRAPACVPGRRN